MPALSVVLAGKDGQDDLEISWPEWQRWQRQRIFRQERLRQQRGRREGPGWGLVLPDPDFSVRKM
jgi:hypothetical protein